MGPLPKLIVQLVILNALLSLAEPGIHEEDPPRSRGIQHPRWRSGLPRKSCDRLCSPLNRRQPGRSDGSSGAHALSLPAARAVRQPGEVS